MLFEQLIYISEIGVVACAYNDPCYSGRRGDKGAFGRGSKKLRVEKREYLEAVVSWVARDKLRCSKCKDGAPLFRQSLKQKAYSDANTMKSPESDPGNSNYSLCWHFCHTWSILPTPYILPPPLRSPWHYSAAPPPPLLLLQAPNERSFFSFLPPGYNPDS